MAFRMEEGNGKRNMSFNGVGRSTTTEFKQRDLKDLTRCQMRTAASVIRKNSWVEHPYSLFDVCAGHGESLDTSPMIFLNELKRCRSMNFVAHFCNDDTQVPKPRAKNSNHKKLIKNVYDRINEMDDEEERDYFEDNVICHKGKFEDTLSWMLRERDVRWRYGLLYYDPNGFSVPEWDFIVDVGKKWHRLDLILNVNTHMIKRLKGNPHAGYRYDIEDDLFYYINLLKPIKKHIYIRDSYGNNGRVKDDKQRFVYLYCTNMDGYSICRPYDFVRLKSSEGASIVRAHMR